MRKTLVDLIEDLSLSKYSSSEYPMCAKNSSKFILEFSLFKFFIFLFISLQDFFSDFKVNSSAINGSKILVVRIGGYGIPNLHIVSLPLAFLHVIECLCVCNFISSWFSIFSQVINLSIKSSHSLTFFLQLELYLGELLSHKRICTCGDPLC